MEKSKKELRADLVAALRSGDYKQAKGILCRIDQTDQGVSLSFCCLGVASILVKEPIPLKDLPPDWQGDQWNGGRVHVWKDGSGFMANVLPKDIKDAYGFKSLSGDFKITQTLKEKFPRLQELTAQQVYTSWDDNGNPLLVGSLTTLNDSCGWSFKEIADLIEFEPEGMFID